MIVRKNQHIRMISEGSCDTEDWSHGISSAITGIHCILKYTEKSYFTIILFVLSFPSNKCSLGEHSRLHSKTLKIKKDKRT